MDAILTDPDVNSRFEICILLNVIVPKFECAGEVWQANTKCVKKPETVQMAPANYDARMLKYDEYHYSIRTLPRYVRTLGGKCRRVNVEKLFSSTNLGMEYARKEASRHG